MPVSYHDSPNPNQVHIMEPFIVELRRRQEQELIALEENTQNESARIESAITILESSLSSIREFVIQYSFEDSKEEIRFFKVTLPEFQSHQLYYISLQRVLLQKPEGNIPVIKKYYKKQLKKVTGFFKEYKGFYEYYRSGAGYLDELYFTRHKTDPSTASQTIPIALDMRYCTPGSFTVATILANRMLEEHFIREMVKLSRKPGLADAADYGIKWTDTRAALEEMIYAFYFKGSFNNGQVEIRKLYEALCSFFGLTPGNIYKSKQDFYGRSNISAYLDLLSKRYKEGMEESDDRYNHK